MAESVRGLAGAIALIAGCTAGRGMPRVRDRQVFAMAFITPDRDGTVSAHAHGYRNAPDATPVHIGRPASA